MGIQVLSSPLPEAPPQSVDPVARFTLDGDARLERRLQLLCQNILSSVRALIPDHRLEALVLGGGYGRGEGGVLKTAGADQPYNDLEFYVFTRGSRLLNERRFSAPLNRLAERLSPAAGLHVEFKIDSLRRLRAAPVSMFSYDLVSGHKLLYGGPAIFRGCEHHLNSADIPLEEATRLLFNRCSGLLLVKELLRNENLTLEQQDFCGRNLAKASLALGDAVLAASAQYHWSCLERHNRLRAALPRAFGLSSAERGGGEWLKRLEVLHAQGVKFKLHPCRTRQGTEQLKARHDELCRLAWQVWLWVEARRLKKSFATPRDYALLPGDKCAGTSPVRNCLLTLRSFGLRSLFDGSAFRYPRDRLLNSLPLLLWEDCPTRETLPRLQKQLHARSGDWQALVGAYKILWPAYG